VSQLLQNPGMNLISHAAGGRKRLDLICRFFFAGLLILAAGFKADLLLTEAETPRYGFQVALIETELIVGAALALGCMLSVARWAALLIFSVFFVYSFLQAASGAQSCGCAGKLSEHVTPWLSTAIDVAAVFAFWKWRPRARAVPFFSVPVMLVPALAVLVFLLQVPGSLAYPRMVLPSAVIELGDLPQAASRNFVLNLKNTHSLPILIDEIESSCPCLSADLPCEIAPGAEAAVPLTLDLAREPTFSGKLSIRCAGRTRLGKIAFVAWKMRPHNGLLNTGDKVCANHSASSVISCKQAPGRYRRTY
jgi:hypothetical protein